MALICLSAAYADLQIWVMWASTVKSSERIKPRLRAEEAKGIVEEQTRIDEGCCVKLEKEREEWTRRASVLSSLSLSL